MNKNACVVQLQELADKVIPAYNRVASYENDFNEALDFAADFNPNAPHTEAEWRKLDIALGKYSLAGDFPELTEAVKKHFSIQMYHDDLYQIVNGAVNMALAICRNPLDADTEIDTFEAWFSEILPESVEAAIREKMREIEKQALEIALDRANKVLAEDLYTLPGELSYWPEEGAISTYFTCSKGKYWAQIDSSECYICPVMEDGELDIDHEYSVEVEEASKQTLIEEIEKFCMAIL